jgi:hypothetical protein
LAVSDHATLVLCGTRARPDEIFDRSLIVGKHAEAFLALVKIG